MTWGLIRNKNITKSETKINAFFGDESWKSLKNSDEFVSHYCNKIQNFGDYKKYKTYTIDMKNINGNRFNLILATQSEGGTNVLKDLRERVGSINSKMMESAFSIAMGNQKQLTDF